VKNRVVLIILATTNLIMAGFIFTMGLVYASHTVRNLSIGCLRLLVHIILSVALLAMLRKGGLTRRDGQVLAILLVLSVAGYLAAMLA
jgi:hypothetical protein